MEKQMVLNIVAEQELGLTARLLLLINKKQLELYSMKMNTDFSSKCYQYTLELTGDEHMLYRVMKVIDKQIGVINVKLNNVQQFNHVEMALA